MNNAYQFLDGTPRYGSRSGAQTSREAAQDPAVRAEEAVESAARLGLDHLSAAIDRRLTSPWADQEEPLVAGLRRAYPREVAAARVLVKLHLGSQRQWRLKAQAVRDKHLAATLLRRRASGSSLQILFLRIGLMIALIAPPAFVVATGRDDIVKLVLTGAVCVSAAFMGGHFITVRSRVPVMPHIRGPWLAELREDIVNATLVAILQNKGVALESKTVDASLRGWKSIQTAAEAVDTLQR